MSNCRITEEGCTALVSALKSNPSHLRELNLGCNNPGEAGVKLLSGLLEDPHCKLEKLHYAAAASPELLRNLLLFVLPAPALSPSPAPRSPLLPNSSLSLYGCSITEEGCAALVSALKSNPSHLRELNLGCNNPGEAGVKLLSGLLEDPHCKLEKLHLYNCRITEEGCAALVSALKSNPSHLRELDLSWNNPGESGVKLLSDLLEDPHCKLEKLELWGCNLTERSCAVLSPALSSNSSSLRELNLGHNELQDRGVKLLSDGLKNPHCKLEKLDQNIYGLFIYYLFSYHSRALGVDWSVISSVSVPPGGTRRGASECAGDLEPEAAGPATAASPEAGGSVPGEPAVNVEVGPPEEGPVLLVSATGELAEAPGHVEHADAAAAEASVAVLRPDTVRDIHGGELQDGCSEPAEGRAPALQEGAAMETDPVFKTPVRRKKRRVRSAASKQAKQGERGDDTDTDNGQSDYGWSVSSQEDTSSTVYTAGEIKAFLQRTKGQKLVQVAECISDWSEFVFITLVILGGKRP
ncbi:hypothetical protein NFI96_009345 [Prochilodus magdalenae]|nr:hypothetical protein NFI96_009345 [Prochilodus magdalenae]